MLAGVRWVALPPDAMLPREPRRRRRPYGGPPRYTAVPRWSLRAWMPAPPPGPEGPLPPRAERTPEQALRARAALIGRLGMTTAVLAGIAALAEAWRYGLLVVSRSSAVSSGPLAVDDALVTLLGLLAPVAALATGVTFLWWLVNAREIAASISGTRPARSTWTVVVGSIVPGPNLTIPGAALTEVEHAASGRPAGTTPRPSRPVARWWIAWAVSVVLGVLAVMRGLGSSTQAMADAVALHALADVAAAVAAVATVRVVAHLTELLAPQLRPAGREALVGFSVAGGSGAGVEGGVAAGGGRGGRVGAGAG